MKEFMLKKQRNKHYLQGFGRFYEKYSVDDGGTKWGRWEA